MMGKRRIRLAFISSSHYSCSFSFPSKLLPLQSFVTHGGLREKEFSKKPPRGLDIDAKRNIII